MIRLEPVTNRTFRKIVDMKLPPEQSKFVAPNVVSLAQAWLYRDEARPFAVCDGDEPVGFMMLDWDEGERTVGIWRFMIAFEHQRKGYGRSAMQAAVQLVRESGKFDLMHLDFVPGNEGARSLYYAMGFRENGDIEDGEIVMTLPLTDDPKLGMLTADDEDMDGFLAVIESEAKAGNPSAEAFSDTEALKTAVAAGRVRRLTIMGKTVGLALDGAILIAQDSMAYYESAAMQLIDS